MIFRLAIHGSAEDGAHPCAPPLRGLAEWHRVRVVLKSNSKEGATALAIALAAKDLQASRLMADPEGGAHGWAPFSVEPWMASRKINDITRSASEPWSQTLSLVTFLCQQRK